MSSIIAVDDEDVESITSKIEIMFRFVKKDRITLFLSFFKIIKILMRFADDDLICHPSV